MYWYGGTTWSSGVQPSNKRCGELRRSNTGNYLVVGQTNCDFANPGGYYSMGTSPAPAGVANPAVPASIAFSGTRPASAGMAAARGLDGSGNLIIIAVGGITNLGISNDLNVHYLYNAGTSTSPIPTWVTASAANPPTPVTNGALVYSHVTGKFYLFGGFSAEKTKSW